MRIPHYLIGSIRAGVVAAFVALTAMILGFLWLNAGGRIPLISQPGYRVDLTLPDVDNLVFQSDVRMAGVNVGKIEALKVRGSDARVTLELNDDVAPLHEGVQITVRNKTLIEETFLDVVDGKGPQIESGRALPDGSGHTSVQLNDVLTSLDSPTRTKLGEVIRSSGIATEGSKADVDAMLSGLGDLGRDGGAALAALADQSEDIKTVMRRTSDVLNALDTQRGGIVELAQHAAALTETTAQQKADIESIMNELPPFMDIVRDASGSLEELGDPLGVVARNLNRGSSDLNAALLQLPATTHDLRALLPQLDDVLKRAPDTLTRTPTFSDKTQPMITTLKTNLADLNPMLSYLKPYGPDLAALFTNMGGGLVGKDVNGNIGRVKTIFGLNSVNSPLDLSPLTMYNPYPAPGSSGSPTQFTGTYPRIQQDPIPK